MYQSLRAQKIKGWILRIEYKFVCRRMALLNEMIFLSESTACTASFIIFTARTRTARGHACHCGIKFAAST